MDRFRLECFVALAEELHFHRAAERCHISQPAMSQQIRALEHEMGVSLAHRTRRSVALSRPGEVFLDEARKLLRQWDHSVALAQRTHRGEIGQIVVGATAPALYVLLPEVVALFRERMPGIGVVVAELSMSEQEAQLRSGDIDVALIHPPLDDPALVAEEVARPAFRIALPEAHPLAAHDALDLAQLAGEQFVVFPRRIAPQLHDTLIALCRDAGFPLDIAVEAHPAQTIIGLVAAGVGLGFIAAEAQQLNRDGVVYRPLRGAPLRLSLGVAHRSGNVPSTVSEFVAAARDAGVRVR
ncbi:LysR family transcriptional regulator [Actinomycetospora sp. NBRC 106378]|uniref:LysR family transcriptional regulator n=1 Tax=Actinomycetospora sp. NBRC 106378 TaxID=3032208 RepID=UPI0024A4AFB9|nr:LysR family transcriptional regulator [Actinomycetospora sp. NBRC 106378]GLZ51744.1 LysR family transcriptional regulator [Actinomycetospora sp. NBRC 106378]